MTVSWPCYVMFALLLLLKCLNVWIKWNWDVTITEYRGNFLTDRCVLYWVTVNRKMWKNILGKFTQIYRKCYIPFEGEITLIFSMLCFPPLEYWVFHLLLLRHNRWEKSFGKASVFVTKRNFPNRIKHFELITVQWNPLKKSIWK